MKNNYHKWPTKVMWINLVFVLIFCAAFFLVRMPFYSNQIKYEEGIFANIYLNDIHGPNYGQIGRINYIPIYIPLSHPGLIYASLAKAGVIYQAFIPLKQMSEVEQSIYLRLGFSLFQLFYWIMIIFTLYRFQMNKVFKKWDWVVKFSLLTISLTPLAIHTSYIIQIDNSIGVLFLGIFAIFSLNCFLNNIKEPWIYISAFIAGIFMGFGKNEWAMIFIFSTIITIIFIVLLNILHIKIPDTRKFLIISAICLFGSIFGSVINYLFDPANYLGGATLLFNFAEKSIGQTIGVVDTVNRILSQNIGYFPYTVPIIIIILISLIYAIRVKLLLNPYILWSFLFSCGIFFMFALAPRLVDEMRYFIVSLITGTPVLIMIIMDRGSDKPFVFFISVCVIFLLIYLPFNYQRSLKIELWNRAHYTETSGYIRSMDQLEKYKETGCIPVLDIGYAYNKGRQDYLASSVPLNLNEGWALKFNKYLCKQ